MHRLLRQIPFALAALAATVALCAPAFAARPHARPRAAIATYYGPGLYGRHTACGQTLTPETVGVASRTLPCGTLVRFSYRGHSAIVPVIDRGPYSFATWDLTTGATQALDIASGVTRVWTRIVGHAANSPALGAPALESAPGPSAGGVALP
jgi:rare lipoprotein A (peptidoglycan hydrolase)